MDIATIETLLYKHWNAEELTEGAGKLAYRIIGGYKFQFRRVDYMQRTSLLIEALAAIKNVTPVIGKVQAFAESEQESEEKDVAAVFDIIPDLIAALATQEIHALVVKLCETVSVDIGEGKFQSLTEEVVAEKVFGDDLTLQIPVALTAATRNLDGILNKIKL